MCACSCRCVCIVQAASTATCTAHCFLPVDTQPQVAEYLEIHGRVQLLNDRFSVMQELLDILRSHAQKSYYSRLEAAVMWLVVSI